MQANSSFFQTPVLLYLLLDLATYGGVDPVGVFTLFKMVVDINATKLNIIFGRQIHWGSCWQSTNVTAIPKGAPSPDRENYHPISKT